MECFEKVRKNRPLMPVQAMKEFEVLFVGSNTKTVGHGSSANPQRQSTVKPGAAGTEAGKGDKSASPTRHVYSISPAKDASEVRNRKSVVLTTTTSREDQRAAARTQSDNAENSDGAGDGPDEKGMDDVESAEKQDKVAPKMAPVASNKQQRSNSTTQALKQRSARRSPYSESIMLKMTHVQPGLGLTQHRQTTRSGEGGDKANRGS